MMRFQQRQLLMPVTLMATGQDAGTTAVTVLGRMVGVEGPEVILEATHRAMVIKQNF